MPIYEYECTACGHKLEEFQKVSDEPLRDCPECKQPSLKKCVTAPAFQLKGTGWYETDFKNPKKPAADNSKEKSGNKDSESKGEKKESTDKPGKKADSTDKSSS